MDKRNPLKSAVIILIGLTIIIGTGLFSAYGTASPAQRGSTIGAGGLHTVELKADGTLWAWGYNLTGALGDGTTTDRFYPVQIGTDNDWMAVSAGSGHTVALKTDGTLWAWGLNFYGELGDGTNITRYSPVKIGADTDWTAISAKQYHTLALKSDGTLWSWGWNIYGQLGDGMTTDRNYPDQIGSDIDWTAISGGLQHTLALKSDGTLWSWGWNSYGQLGLGVAGVPDTTDRYSPTQVADTDWTTISAGMYHSVGLKSDGTLWIWGDNSNGALGYFGVPLWNSVPSQMGTDTNWSAIAAGHSYTVALKSDGRLWAWGRNEWGQVGDGTATTDSLPVQIGTDTDWTTITSGGYHTVALKSDGSLSAWGRNGNGQVGDGTTTDAYSPVLITGPGFGWSAHAVGRYHTAALKSDGTRWAWGRNDHGQLGDGTTNDSDLPIQIGADTDWMAIAAGTNYTIALKSDGTLYAWGYNFAGQLGLGDTTDRYSPTQVAGTDWVDIAAYNSHTMALKSDGTRWAWGGNLYGVLGLGDTTDRYSPTQVAGTDWVAIAAGQSFSIGLKSDGTLWTGGRNENGQLGDGTTTFKTSPVKIGFDTDWTAIDGGSYYGVALKSDGTLWAWGLNNFGQHGNGGTTNTLSPVPSSGADWTAVAVGHSHTLALNSDGTLWAWGNNMDGALGDGTTNDSYSPIPIGADTDWTAIAAGDGPHSAALKSDGTLWAWGYNLYGQLGDGSLADRYSPVQVVLDTDGDGMDDNWEFTHFEDLSHDGTSDGDSDALIDLEEFQNGTDPNDPDSDSDGYNDGREVAKGTDPLDDMDYLGVPDTEWSVLVDLYNSTDGDDWTNTIENDEIWEVLDPSSNECDWYGVTCTGNHVNRIELTSNNLVGTIPASIEDLSNLMTLSLGYNQLTGSIPTALGSLGSLEYIELSYNQLSDSIPAELGSLSNLTVLRLYNNELSGSIPPVLGNLGSLTVLYLSDNRLSGSIPVELEDLTNLMTLSLGYNQLTGSIPTALGSLTNLSYLDLSGNQLSGEIPTTLTGLSILTTLDIGYNSLYTSDSGLITFLNGKDPDWENTQTIAPTDLTATVLSDTSVRLDWTQIPYTGDTGYYDLCFATTTPDGPCTFSASSSPKTTDTDTVSTLVPGTTYYVRLRTVTEPHPNNQNTVLSEYTPEVIATTTGSPVDTDGDGLSDYDENSIYGTDPLNPDSDSDGLTDGDEVNIYGTLPLNPDSDGDKISDGYEVQVGTDPNSASSTPSIPITGVLHRVTESDGITINTSFEVLINDGFVGSLPSDIKEIIVRAPDNSVIAQYSASPGDWTYFTEFRDFFVSLGGEPPLNGVYSFEVQSVSLTGSDTDHQYTTRNLPIPDPTQLSPADGANITTKTPSFSWGPVVYPDTPIYYRLEIITDDPGYNRVFASGRELGMLSCTVPQGILIPGETYKWRLRVVDNSDWKKIQNRSNCDWQTFTMAPTLSHSVTPAISLDGWGNLSWTWNVGQTGTEVWVKIYDHDGVASDGSSHTITIQRPDDLTAYPMYFARPFGPTSAGYEIWFDIPPVVGDYIFTITDPDGNTATLMETLDAADINPLDPPVESSITPNLLTEHITASFDNILVNGVDYDNFDSYSSIGDLDNSKWGWRENVSISGGQLVSTLSDSVGRANGGLYFTNPETINSIQADITVTDISDLDGPPKARISGAFCHNGTGDVFVTLSVKGDKVYWDVSEQWINEQQTYEWNDLGNGTLLTGISPNNTIRVSISWDDNTNEYTLKAENLSSPGQVSQSFPVSGNINPPIDAAKAIQTRINLVTDDTTPTFEWDPVLDANRYRLRIYNYDNNNRREIWRGTFGEQPDYTVPPGILNPNSYYRFRVAAWDAHNPLNVNNVSKTPPSSNDNYSFYTGDQEDEVPFIDLYHHGVHVFYNLSGSYLQFWIQVHDAQGVPGNIKHVKVIHPNFQEELLEYYGDNPFVHATPTSSIYYLESLLLPVHGGTYTFVVEDNDGHTFPITEELTVDPIGFPNVASLSPSDGTNLGTTGVTFSWDSVADAKFYHIDIFDYDFNRVYSFFPTDTFYELPAGILKANTLYRWRVKPRKEFFSENVDNVSSSPGSSLQSLTFTTTPPIDTDGDGLPDWWEVAHGLDPNTNDSDGDTILDQFEDLDLDNSNNLAEYNNATDPNIDDTDGDGVNDGADFSPLNPNEAMDSDGDGLGDDSDPCPNDPYNDEDYDGLCYQEELDLGTNPNDPDSDGDGVLDGADAFPLDPAEGADSDGDGWGDNSDKCPALDSSQDDYDNDGVGDECDKDADGDGFYAAPEGDDCDDFNENVYPGCPDTTPGCPCEGVTYSENPPAGTCNPNQDCDGDGIKEKDDTCPGLDAPQTDTDGDGKGDACDNCIAYPNPDQSLPIWYKDHDLDGYHNGDTMTQCEEPTDDIYKLAGDLASMDIDCDDNDNTVYPDATDLLKNCDPSDDPAPPAGEYYIKVEMQRCTDAACSSTETKDYGSWDPQDGDELIVTFKAMNGDNELPTDVNAVPPRVNSNFMLALATPAVGTFNPTKIPGKYLNDPSEAGLADPGLVSPDFDNITFGTNQVRFTCLDYGGFITIHAEVPITKEDGTVDTLQKDCAFPKDSDADGLADFWETQYGDLIPTADPDLDGINTKGEYRGVKWGTTIKVNPDPNNDGIYDTVAYEPEGIVKHFRTDPKDHRDLFVKYRGFIATHPFAVGEAFEKLAAKVAIHAIDEADAVGLGEYGGEYYKIDVATVSLEDRALGSENPHIDRWTTRNWTFRTLGKSSFGGDDLYGATCFVYKKSLDAFYTDKPHHDYTTFTGSANKDKKKQSCWNINPNTELDAISKVEDGNDNGKKDTREDLSGDGRLDGDYPVLIDISASEPNPAYNDPNTPGFPVGLPDIDGDGKDVDIDGDGKDDEWDFRFELSPFNVDNDLQVELPVVGSVQEIDLVTENTLAQGLKMVITHELGHNVGIGLHTNDSLCAMNNESNNLIRDNHFSQTAADLVRIHNQ